MSEHEFPWDTDTCTKCSATRIMIEDGLVPVACDAMSATTTLALNDAELQRYLKDLTPKKVETKDERFSFNMQPWTGLYGGGASSYPPLLNEDGVALHSVVHPDNHMRHFRERRTSVPMGFALTRFMVEDEPVKYDTKKVAERYYGMLREAACITDEEHVAGVLNKAFTKIDRVR